MYIVYILESQKNGRWYIGHTANLEERLAIHNSGKVILSAPYAPYGVIHKEEFATKSEAAKRERQIKRSGIIRKAIKNRIKRERLNIF
ncbi:GIY-YIG nuclease family protein [bacterium]|nr:GIY-YIG nuclease family protein [bacterium]